MSTVHYRVNDVYIGGFGDGAKPLQPGAVECPAPEHAQQKWDGAGWGAIPVNLPVSITRRQGRRALLQAGLLTDVEQALASISDLVERMDAQIEYEAETWERSNPWIERTGTAIGLTAEQIDDLFISAAAL